ncbi:hypothetical protein NUACC21_77010 [Scytonema sp. NUACC21]
MVKLAIVGMESFFGNCYGLDNFQHSIYEANQHFIPVPHTRYQNIQTTQNIHSKNDFDSEQSSLGAYIENFEIDTFYFKIPPHDLDKYDTQQLLMLKVIDNALRDADLDEKGKLLQNMAIVTVIKDEPVLEMKTGSDSSDKSFLKQQKNLVYNKISSLWNISGPNFSVCVEENSVFDALEIAKMLLTVGSADAVVVGAVNLANNSALWYDRLASMNTGKPTLSYDRNGNGSMLGEGAGAIVLKRYEKAKQDSDRIYAVIDSVVVTHKASATPSESARQCCYRAFEEAEVEPTDIGYLEVFGSGIEEQDKAEINGLLQAYHVPGAELSCAIGSVKSNIGHTYIASGIASLIKTALCLYNRYIPATPQWSGFKKPEIWENSPFYVPTESRPWLLTKEQTKRVAAINSLDKNANFSHAIISEDPSQENRSNKSLQESACYLCPIAANELSALLEQLDVLEQKIKNSSSLSATASEIWSAFHSNSQATYALAIVGHNKKELLREIERGRKGVADAFAQGKEWKSPVGSYFTAKPLGKKGTVAFVYPGAFNSYIGMGRKLFNLFPKTYDRVASFVCDQSQFFRDKQLYPRSLHQLSKRQLEDLETQFLSDTLGLQVSGTGFSVLWTFIMKEYFQVQPQVAFGYSMGESSMLYALNVWVSAEEVSNFVHSSPIFQTRLAGSKTVLHDYWGLSQANAGEDLWHSYVLMAPVSAVKTCLERESQVYLTNINTPTEVVIGGEPQACLRVIQALKCEAFRAPADMVLHCEPTVSEYRELIKLNTTDVNNVKNINFYSSAHYDLLRLDKESLAHSISQGFSQLVDFPRLVHQVYEDGARIFIELGPGNTCSRWISENLQQKEHITMSVNRRGVDDFTAIVRVLAQLLSHRVSMDLSPLYSPILESVKTKKTLIKTVTPDSLPLIPANNTTSETKRSENSAVEKPSNIVLDESQVLEFAKGQVSRVLGKDFESIDPYTKRVRLPSPPYLFVSRVTKLEGQRGEYDTGFIQTEYDVPQDAWYSVDGQIPLGIYEEAGQGILLLLGYLGTDFENQGKRSFRLLDLTATFLCEPPQEVKTLRYDIKIDSYVRTTSNLIVFFHADCFVGDKQIIKISGGCAGLFSEEELEQGQGIIVTEREEKERSRIQKKSFQPLLLCQKSTFEKDDLLHLSQGNIAACFGDNYEQNGLNPSLRLPSKMLTMVDRVISVDPKGGVAGLGLVIAEKTVEPKDWYFLCHFKNDPTMPGSLMIEGSSQVLQFYTLFLGLQKCTLDARFQPISQRPQVSRFRGQVTPTSGKLIYRLEVMEISLSPTPFVICNVDIIFGDKTIATAQNLGWQLSEKPEQTLLVKQNLLQKPVLFNESQVQELTKGAVATCLGPEYQIYDNRRSVCLPNRDLCLVSRILEFEGKRHDLTKTANLVTEYDVSPEAWFFRHNSYPYLPYCTYIEIAGQPCIFLGVYLGAPLLLPEENLHFRNLDGKGTILRDVDVRGKTITDKVHLKSSTVVQGAIIQKFDFQLLCDGELFYQSEMVFGYFSDQMLANQVGLDGGKVVRPWYEDDKNEYLSAIAINLKNPLFQEKFYQAPLSKPYYHLAHGQLNFLDEVLIVEAGGKYQQGYIYGSKDISPTDWYFPYHFYQDPVMPGSLGIEAILQAMQVYALQLDLGRQFKSPRFGQVFNHEMTWKYRGQVTPENHKMYFEVHISKIDVNNERVIIVGDASLWKDNMRIYEVKDIAISLLES